MQIVALIENSPITGVRYGTIEFPTQEIPKYLARKQLGKHNKLRKDVNRLKYVNSTRQK